MAVSHWFNPLRSCSVLRRCALARENRILICSRSCSVALVLSAVIVAAGAGVALGSPRVLAGRIDALRGSLAPLAQTLATGLKLQQLLAEGIVTGKGVR